MFFDHRGEWPHVDIWIARYGEEAANNEIAVIRSDANLDTLNLESCLGVFMPQQRAPQTHDVLWGFCGWQVSLDIVLLLLGNFHKYYVSLLP